MKLSFYYVDQGYIEYLKEKEIEYRGFTTVPNLKYASKTKFVYGVVMQIGELNYFVPVTYIDNRNDEKVEIIIDELKSSPTTQMNLMSFLTNNTELLNYSKKEDEINLTFNKFLLNDFKNKKMLEEVKYAISFSIKDNLNISKINFYVNDNFITKCILQN